MAYGPGGNGRNGRSNGNGHARRSTARASRADSWREDLQALLADAAPAGIRDVTFAIYFTLAFGVGSLWTALYGVIIDRAGNAAGLPIVFWAMTASFIAAAIVMAPVRDVVHVGPSPEPVETV